MLPFTLLLDNLFQLLSFGNVTGTPVAPCFAHAALHDVVVARSHLLELVVAENTEVSQKLQHWIPLVEELLGLHRKGALLFTGGG